MLNIDEIKDKRIAVLLSGGVDSSVVVWEFARLGLHPDCFYIKIGPEEKGGVGLLFGGGPGDGYGRGYASMAASCKWLTVIRNTGTR